MTIIETPQVVHYAEVASAIDAAKAEGWEVFVRGAKKAIATRTTGTGKKATTEAMFLGGAEGARYWAIMRQA